MKGSVVCAGPGNSPRAGLGTHCMAPSTSIVVGMVSHQPPADGQETNTLGFQDGAAKKSVKNVHLHHAISLNHESATSDNACTFLKVSLISKFLHNWLFWSNT